MLAHGDLCERSAVDAIGQTRRYVELVAAGEWPAGSDPALQARLIRATLHGLMAHWHLAPRSFDWEAAATSLAAAADPMPQTKTPPSPGGSP